MVNKELKNIYEKYENVFPASPEPEIIMPEGKFENLCCSLTGINLFICSAFFDLLFRNLSGCSRNALLRLSENKMDLNTYCELVVKPGHKFENIPNIGVISCEELLIFNDRLLTFMQNIKDLGNNYDELLPQYVKVYIEAKFNIVFPDDSDILTIIKREKYIPRYSK